MFLERSVTPHDERGGCMTLHDERGVESNAPALV